MNNNPTHPNERVFTQGFAGLTKREYFAAMALQGLVSKVNHLTPMEDVAIKAVKAADALIEELNK